MYKGNYYTINGEYVKKNNIEGFADEKVNSTKSTFRIVIYSEGIVSNYLKLIPGEFKKVSSISDSTIFELNYIDDVPYLVYVADNGKKAVLIIDQKMNPADAHLGNMAVTGKFTIEPVDDNDKPLWIATDWVPTPGNTNEATRRIIFSDISQIGGKATTTDIDNTGNFVNTKTEKRMLTLPLMVVNLDSQPEEQPEEQVNNIQDSINNMQQQFETLKNDLKTSCPRGHKCIPNAVWSSLSNKIDNLDSEFDNSLILDGDK